jgi:hypothetical protein
VTENPRSPRRIRESLDAFARVSVSVSLEDAVMARIRATGVAPARFGRRARAVIGGALAAGFLGELVAFVLAAALILPPVYAFGVRFDVPGTAARQTAEVLVALVNVLLTLGAAAGTLVSALSRFMPPAWLVAATFVALLSLSTFVVVRRDLRRMPATGGLS